MDDPPMARGDWRSERTEFMTRRQTIVLLLSGGLVMALAGPLMLLAPSRPQRAARQVVDALARAAEAQDTAAFALHIHRDYRGVYGDRRSLIAAFESVRGTYTNARIRIRSFEARSEDNRIGASFEWTWAATIRTGFKQVRTDMFEQVWAPARVVLAREEPNGPWRVLAADTRVPAFRATGSFSRPS